MGKIELGADMRLLKLKEAADILGVTTRTLRRWIADGRLDAQKVGAQWRVSEAALRKVAGADMEAGGEAGE